MSASRKKPAKKSSNRRHVSVSIRDVAKRAGVSISTVSRAVNGIASVEPKLAKRVWRAVTEVGYVPNPQARALVSGRSRMLGLIVSDITNPFFPELVKEFEILAVEQGYEVLIGSTYYDPARTGSLIRRMLQRNVDGVAIMTFGIEGDEAKGSGANMCEGAQEGQWRSKDYAASTAFQIAGTVWSLIRRLPRANCPLRIRWSSSIPAMVVAAQSKFLKPSIGPVRDLIPR
jgi:hypothetical protein